MTDNPVPSVNFKNLLDLHRKTQKKSMNNIHQHVEQDGHVFKSVKRYLLKRAKIELQYAHQLEKLAKNFKIKTSKGGFVKPNNDIAKRALQSSSFNASQSKNVAHTLAEGPTGLSLNNDQIRPVDLVTAFLIQETEMQSKSRHAFATRLSQNVTNLARDWSKYFKHRLVQGSKYGKIIRQEFANQANELPVKKKSYQRAFENYQRHKDTFNALSNAPGAKNSVEYSKMHDKFQMASLECQQTRNDYILAVESINTLVKVINVENLPRLFEICSRYFLKDLGDICLEFDKAAKDCYSQSLLHIEKFSKTVGMLSTNAEFEWFTRVKRSVPKAPLYFHVEYNPDDYIAQITNSIDTAPVLDVLLRNLVKKREKAASLTQTLEKDIKGTEQMVKTFLHRPELGALKAPLSQCVDFRFRLVIAQNHIAQLDSQIRLLVHAGVHRNEPVVPVAEDMFQISADYVSVHKNELDLRCGEMIRVVDDRIYSGWILVRNLLGREGYVPVVLLTGLGKGEVLQVVANFPYEATCPGEISLTAGDLIRVTDMDTGSTAWWEGDKNGVVGQFPRAYVEPNIPTDVLARGPAALVTIAELSNESGSGNEQLPLDLSGQNGSKDSDPVNADIKPLNTANDPNIPPKSPPSDPKL